METRRYLCTHFSLPCNRRAGRSERASNDEWNRRRKNRPIWLWCVLSIAQPLHCNWEFMRMRRPTTNWCNCVHCTYTWCRARAALTHENKAFYVFRWFYNWHLFAYIYMLTRCPTWLDVHFELPSLCVVRFFRCCCTKMIAFYLCYSLFWGLFPVPIWQI